MGGGTPEISESSSESISESISESLRDARCVMSVEQGEVERKRGREARKRGRKEEMKNKWGREGGSV